MFYPSDWMRDMQEHSLETRGAWTTILCKLHWANTRGEFTKTIEQWARILGVNEQRAEALILYLGEQKIADVECVSRECPATFRIVSRRMQYDENERVRWAESKRVHRMSRECPGDVPPLSRRSSSSSSYSNKEYKPKDIVIEEYWKKRREKKKANVK